MLVIEDGTGTLIDVESYISVEEADTYHTAMGNLKWFDYEEAEKEVFLRRASRDIDLIYGASWMSTALTTTQVFQWPRTNFYIDYVPVTGIPKQLKAAVAELALIEVTVDITGPVDETGNIRSISKSLDGVGSKSITYFSPSSANSSKLRKIGLLLTGLIGGRSGSMYVDVVRG